MEVGDIVTCIQRPENGEFEITKIDENPYGGYRYWGFFKAENMDLWTPEEGLRLVRETKPILKHRLGSK